MNLKSRCLYNPQMRCRGAYWSYRRGMEIIHCWQDNSFFLAEIEWFLTGRGFEDKKRWSLCQPPRDYEFEQLRKAKIWGYFGNDYDTMANTLYIIEPWIKDRWHMTPRICEVMQQAETRFLEIRLAEIIEIGEQRLNI